MVVQLGWRGHGRPAGSSGVKSSTWPLAWAAASSSSIRALRDHQVRQRFERRWAGERGQASWDLIFCTTIGTQLDGRNVAHRFQALCRQAGLPRVRFHDLRHSAASVMLAQGVPARVIMETLGHATIGTTLNLYAHVLPALQQEAADRMDAALGGGA